jgi:hypothetical protein
MNTPVPPTPPSSAILRTLASTTTSTGTIVQSETQQIPLQLGQTLTGTVLSRFAPGQILIQTDGGQLTLQTAANILNGSAVSLQIQTTGTQPQVLITPLLGQTRTPTNANLSTSPAITSNLTQGSIASATVLSTISIQTSQLPGAQGPTGVTLGAMTPSITPILGVVGSAQPAPAGKSTSVTATGITPTSTNVTAAGITPTSTNVTAAGITPMSASVTATGITPTSVSVTAAGITPTSTSVTTAGTSLGSNVPADGKTVPPTFPNGTTFNVQIVSVVLAGSGTPLSASKAQGALTGTVSGSTPTGQTVVQTAFGEIALSAHSTPPRGTQFHMQIIGTPKFPMGTSDTSSLMLSRQWNTLKDALAFIQSGDPAAARNMMQQVLPQAGGPMTTGMLFFLSAMMTGNLRGWMGEEVIRVLQRSGGNLIDRLRQDIGEMQRMANEPSSQEWRTYLIPLIAGMDLQQLKLFIRGEKESNEDSKQGKNRDIRFVIEVEFSKLGPFQFDGLTRDKTIDLMVRTHNTLAEDMRDDIRGIFGNATSALGFTGSINFQQTEIFELNPTREVHASQSRLTV